MNAANYITECRQYIDHYGMFKNQKKHKLHDGNSTLYWAHALLFAKKTGVDAAQLISPKAWEAMLNKISFSLGVLNRSPVKKNAEAHDNYIGAFSGSKTLGTNIFMNLAIAHGRNNDWTFANKANWNYKTSDILNYATQEHKGFFHDRFLYVVPFYLHCLFGKCGKWNELRWSLDLIAKAVWRRSASSVLLTLHTAEEASQSDSLLLSLSALLWKIRHRHIYKWVQEYFGPNHVLTRYSKEYYKEIMA